MTDLSIKCGGAQESEEILLQQNHQTTWTRIDCGINTHMQIGKAGRWAVRVGAQLLTSVPQGTRELKNHNEPVVEGPKCWLYILIIVFSGFF